MGYSEVGFSDGRRDQRKRMVLRYTNSVLVVLIHLILFFGAGFAQSKSGLKWEVKILTVDSNEGIDVADFNQDGLTDVVAGRNWYAAPEFTPRPVRTIEDWSGYVLSNGDYAIDLNGDGRPDVLAGAFNLPEVHWYENPGQPGLSQGKMWDKHLLMDTGAKENEGQLLRDLNGDGIPEWIVSSWNAKTPLVLWQFGKWPVESVPSFDGSAVGMPGGAAMQKVVIGEELNGHGLGIGDLNGDGHEDILFESGWYEAPPADPFSRPWKLHADWTIHASVPFLVRDLNNDSRADVIVGRAHDYGLYWWEQGEPSPDGRTAWVEHLIDDSFSQPHSLHWADLDADGEDELITGKRVHAHNGRDPGGNEPPCIYYYKWREDRQMFERYIIDEGRVGGGLQIRTADLNNDGRLDIAVAGKSGTYVLFNQGK